MTAVIASDSTYGAKTTSRRNARPRSRRLSSSARPMLSGSCTTSESATMIRLWPTAFWNTSSDSASP